MRSSSSADEPGQELTSRAERRRLMGESEHRLVARTLILTFCVTLAPDIPWPSADQPRQQPVIEPTGDPDHRERLVVRLVGKEPIQGSGELLGRKAA